MKITIEVLDSGHLIEVETEEGIMRHCAGKWHSVCSILKKYLYKPAKGVGRPKKKKKKVRKI